MFIVTEYAALRQVLLYMLNSSFENGNICQVFCHFRRTDPMKCLCLHSLLKLKHWNTSYVGNSKQWPLNMYNESSLPYCFKLDGRTYNIIRVNTAMKPMITGMVRGIFVHVANNIHLQHIRVSIYRFSKLHSYPSALFCPMSIFWSQLLCSTKQIGNS